jgi:SAM-dependent methyltransferase
MNMDKAGENYWSNVWESQTIPDSIDIEKNTLANHSNLSFHKEFYKFFKNEVTAGKSIIEIGCGNSVWLPYFNKVFKLNVVGLDYSEFGCKQAVKILEREGVNGQVFCADMFNPPTSLIGQFDYLISMGVIEHFDETDKVVEALKKFLKPGGVLITTLPNHTGLLGFFQRILNKPIYNIHKIIGKEDVENAILKNGLEVKYSSYILSLSLFINMEDRDNRLRYKAIRNLCAKALGLITKMVWFFEVKFFALPKSQFFSPAIIVIAK